MVGEECPFLESVVYKTVKGMMIKHYCKARGLRDVLNRDTWKKICLKGGRCVIRENAEKLLGKK